MANSDALGNIDTLPKNNDILNIVEKLDGVPKLLEEKN